MLGLALAGFLLVGVVAASERVAFAAGPTDPATNKDIDVPAKFRDGFSPSATMHTGMAHVAGYPNDARAINNPDFYSSSDLLYGTSFSFHLGYALTDFLSAGFMMQVDHYESAHWKSHGLGVGMRLDAFPLVRFYPRIGDLGIFGEVGVGSSSLETKFGRYPNVDGTQSYVGTGAFYELTLARLKRGHLALAPELKYTHIDAMSISADSLTAGLRLAYYLSK